jgi:phospholipid-translocating ATPase
MARIKFDGEGPSHVSKPVKRMRWASQHLTPQSALKKRLSIVGRLNKRSASAEEKPRKDDTSPSLAKAGSSVESPGRTIYVNLPIPERDGDGNLRDRQHFDRNKVRTSKYTPLSFIPKNMWFQFHNVANLYFLFIIILGVRSNHPTSNLPRVWLLTR